MEKLGRIGGCDNASRAVDVIFVHGVDGDAVSTWHPKGQPDKFWPQWLSDDVPEVGVWSLDYDASTSAWRGSTMPLVDRATNILDLLELEDIGARSVVFVCHSLGGLLVKQLLRHAYDLGNTSYRRIADQTRAIVFISTPHSGADLASWLQHLSLVLRATVTVDELTAHHPRLRELNLWYRNLPHAAQLKTLVYCEKRDVGGVLVVNETTADPGIAGVIPIPLDEDHISIAKPPSRDAQLYKRVNKLVWELSRPH